MIDEGSPVPAHEADEAEPVVSLKGPIHSPLRRNREQVAELLRELGQDSLLQQERPAPERPSLADQSLNTRTFEPVYGAIDSDLTGGTVSNTRRMAIVLTNAKAWAHALFLWQELHHAQPEEARFCH